MFFSLLITCLTVRLLGFSTVAVVLTLYGCAGDEAERSMPPPDGPFAETLAEIGGGGAHGSLGVSWADRRLVETAGYGDKLIVSVLQPNANTVLEGARVLRRRYGFDPLASERYVSLGGSYAFGLRLDGVDGRGLASELVAAGGKSRTEDGLELVEIGDYAVVPDALLAADVNGLGAFDALGRDLSILAISDRALNALLGEGDRLLDEPVYAAAARCLGDVVAVRLIPDKHLLGTEVGIELAAIGIARHHNVLCTLGGSAGRAAEVAANLESSLDPAARDPVTGEPLADSVASVSVTRDGAYGVEAVRAELEPAPGSGPGWLLGTIATGSLIAMIQGQSESPLP